MRSRRRIGRRGLIVGIIVVLSAVFMAANGGFDGRAAASGVRADGTRLANYDIRSDLSSAADIYRETARHRVG